MGSGSNLEANWNDRFVGSLDCKVVFPARPINEGRPPEVVRTRVLSISAIELVVDLSAQPGEAFVANVHQFGKITGTVSGATAHGSVLHIDVSAPERRALVGKVLWLKRHHAHQAKEERTKPRVPQAAKAAYLYAGDREVACSVIDVSLSGVGVQLKEAVFPVGTRLTLGCIPIVVVRIFEGGFGARFLTPVAAADLDQIFLQL